MKIHKKAKVKNIYVTTTLNTKSFSYEEMTYHYSDMHTLEGFIRSIYRDFNKTHLEWGGNSNLMLKVFDSPELRDGFARIQIFPRFEKDPLSSFVVNLLVKKLV